MAYYTGIAQDMAGLKTALVEACTQNGWTFENDCLVKGACNFRVLVVNPKVSIGVYYQDFYVLTLSDPDLPLHIHPRLVVTGSYCPVGGAPKTPASFPCKYCCFVFDFEVYFWFELAPSYWHWLAFGQSNLPGLPAPAPWFGGTCNLGSTLGVQSYYTRGWSDSGFELFPGSNSFAGSAVWNPWAAGWSVQGVGTTFLAPLREISCPRWNSEPVLLPLREFAPRGEGKYSLVVDLEHARHARLDYNAPGDIVTLGSDRWMLLPWYHKTPVIPANGIRWEDFSGSSYVNCTGPYGIAVRYEGP